MPPLTPRLIFAHQLRGVAALLIVITHFFGNFYGTQAGLAALTFSPDLHMIAAPWVRWFDFPYFKGPFGVAVFFLISGFVIPFSLEKATPPRFLLMRAFRIYPTYVAAFALSMLAMAASAHYWQLPFTHSAAELISNALLVNNLVGISSVDPINWTLSIEIKFYLTAAVLGSWLFRRQCVYLALWVTLLLAGTAVLSRVTAPPPWLLALAAEWHYLIFMLIGVTFYQHISKLISMPALLARSLLLLAAFGLNWSISPQRDALPIIGIYYLYAYLVFGLCYLGRGWFRPLRLLDFLADISFPLYVVHSLAGFAALKVMLHAGVPFGVAVVPVLTLVIVVATLLHRLVELPSNAFGKRLAHRPATTVHISTTI